MRITLSLRHLLVRNGIYCSKVVPSQRLRDFLSLVCPIHTNLDLVRIGAPNDGGYLIPDDLGGIEACFSPGVGQSTYFEEDLAKLGIRSYLADGSLDKLPSTHKLFHFTKKYLSDHNSSANIRLEDWIKGKIREGQSDLILQMDIEGGEYTVIYDTPDKILNKFRIIVIEFHHMDLLISEGGFDLIKFAFSKILTQFSVVHIHPNNHKKFFTFRDFLIPEVMEFTFLRNDRVQLFCEEGFTRKKLSFPHELDSPNATKRVDKALPKCWYDPS